MPDVLMYADTFRSPELRHEVPLGVPDPFLYAEQDGVKHIAIGSMEVPRLRALGLFELHPSEEFGLDELIASGLSYPEVRAELAVRAVAELGIDEAVVPETFPLWLADRLRADGVELTVDASLFDDAAPGEVRRPSSPGSGVRSAPPRRVWTPRVSSCGAPSRTVRASRSTASRLPSSA